MKWVALALWCVVTALSSSYAAAWWRLKKLETPQETAPGPVALEQKKTRVISVPMIVDGKVRGYVVAQFAYTVDSNAFKATGVSADTYILDEAFRLIYADDKLDFRHLGKFDLDQLAKRIQDRANDKLGTPAVREVLVNEFNFVSSELIGARMSGG